jgi:hypothetical protein
MAKQNKNVITTIPPTPITVFLILTNIVKPLLNLLQEV